MLNFRSIKLLVIAAAALGISACSTVSEKASDLKPKADLVDTLKGDGPFTVFAPTDEAFDALPEGTLASLLEEANRDKLVAILTYHVVPGKVTAADLVGQTMDAGTVNGATVTVADIEASNGVIHVIDTVLLPQ